MAAGKSSETSGLGEDGLARERGLQQDASVQENARPRAHSKISVDRWVDGVESVHL